MNTGEDCYSIKEEYVGNLLKRHSAEHSSAYLGRAKYTSEQTPRSKLWNRSILENSLELVTKLEEMFCRLTFTLLTFIKRYHLRRSMRKFVHGWLWFTLDESPKKNNANRRVTACSSPVNNGSFSRFLSGFLFYEGGPKITRTFYGGEGGGTSVCSRLVRVRDCPPHQLAKRRPWGKFCRVRVIFFLSLCHCFLRFFDGRLKRKTCLHQVLFHFGKNSSRNCHNASRGF